MARGRNGSRARGRTAPTVLGDRERGSPLKFRGHGLAGVWDTRYLVTLAGSNVATLGERYFGVLTLTAAGSPLYTGAASYNKWPSIQFTAASSSRLFRSSTNLLGTGPVAYLLAGRMRTLSGGLVANESSGRLQGSALYYSPGNGLDFTKNSVMNHYSPTLSTVPFALVATHGSSAGVPTLSFNGVAQTMSGTAAALSTPTASGELTIGALYGAAIPGDFDFLSLVWFQAVPPASVTGRIAKGIGAAAGIRIAA